MTKNTTLPRLRLRGARLLAPHPSGTHCHTCHRSWRGWAEIHCVGCHEHFSSDDALQLHQTGVKCRPPADVKGKETGKPVFRIRQSPLATTWVRADDRDLPWVVSESA
jgi:hypothetical protein